MQTKQEGYKLIGIGNWFSITPGFVTPVFKRNNYYYVMDKNLETNDTNFIRLPFTHEDNIIKLSDLAVDYLNVKDNYNEHDELIGAFQISDEEVVIGQLDLFVSMLNDYITDDKILAKEIIDYINEIQYYLDFRNNKKSR